MTSRIIRNDRDLADLNKFLGGRQFPLTVDIRKGAHRSNNQNRTQRMWFKEAEEQGDMTAEEYRGLCKLQFGVAIMKENDFFRESFERTVENLPYETRLALMMDPIDLPVTRNMTTEQQARYLDQIQRYFRVECGFHLTEPNRPPVGAYA